MTSSPGGPVIQTAAGIHLTADEKTVLRAMFSDFSRIAVEAGFGYGRSGSRVLQVRPVPAGGKAQLPAAVKIAPIGLIRKEAEAYQTWVHNKLPEIAHLEPPPTFPPDSLSGGLRYALAGGGVFPLKSLLDYAREADVEDVLWVLNERLFPIMSQNWWLDNRANRAFQLRADYDALLPVNLILKASPASSGGDVYLLEPGQLPENLPPAGARVCLEGFVVTELEPQQGQLTLNLPASSEGLPSDSHRLRVENVPDTIQYQVGDVVASLFGEVVATRDELMAILTRRALGEDVDLSAERLTLPGASSPLVKRGERAERRSLPNPLRAYPAMLQDFLKVRIATIHGDFNLQNILVDPAARNVSLIDFATVREGHALHDLLRLETGVVTWLVPEALSQAELPPETIHPLYEQLHSFAYQPGRFRYPRPPHTALEKPMAMLAAIRNMARDCLFNAADWTEYYRALTLCLLGTLKYRDLDEVSRAKEVAFWGAATLVDQQTRPYAPPPPRQGKKIALKLKGHNFEVRCVFAGQANIGRSPGCDFPLPRAPSTVSLYHARISFSSETGSYSVEDLASTNGTYVDGDRIKGVRHLDPGARVGLGASLSFDFEYYPDDPFATGSLIYHAPDGRELARYTIVPNDKALVGNVATEAIRFPYWQAACSLGYIVRRPDGYYWVDETAGASASELKLEHDMELELGSLGIRIIIPK